MKKQHLFHIQSTLKRIEKNLEDYQKEFKKLKDDRIVMAIDDIRSDINQILKKFNITEEKRNIYKDLRILCAFFEADLTELEPDRFQKAYGKFESKEEEEFVFEFVNRLKDKIKHLEGIVNKSC